MESWSLGRGGGVLVTSSQVTVEGSTISNNVGQAEGGGSAVEGSAATVVMKNSTLSANRAVADTSDPEYPVLPDGSAIHVRSPATVRLDHVGVIGTAERSMFWGTGITASASVFAATDSAAVDVCAAPIVSLGYNASSGTTCGLVATGDIQGVDMPFDLLASNGGPTQTHCRSWGARSSTRSRSALRVCAMRRRRSTSGGWPVRRAARVTGAPSNATEAPANPGGWSR